MPFSLTYLAIFVLTYLGVGNAEEVAQAAAVVIAAVMGLYGRYRVGDISLLGLRK